MKFGLLCFFVFYVFLFAGAQKKGVDYTWWNELHGWEQGDPGWRNWMISSPGYMGPNALPVPPVKKGLLADSTLMELTLSSHYLKGDPTQDISGRLYIPFANNKVAIELYGVAIERYAFSEDIRNERFARDKDGKGFAVGDFYFSTLIQISKNRKFPNTLFRFSTKTASGSQLQAARYIDSPGYFFDLSFSEAWRGISRGIFRPFGLIGFYSWQTNDELNLQNDALLYAIGCDFEKKQWMVSTSMSGYSGYKKERDRPIQLNFDFQKKNAHNVLRLQYAHGLKKWQYKTLRFSFIWDFDPAK